MEDGIIVCVVCRKWISETRDALDMKLDRRRRAVTHGLSWIIPYTVGWGMILVVLMGIPVIR